MYIAEFRCNNCRRLLFKETVRDGFIEIKCPHCNAMNTIERKVVKEYEWAKIDKKKKIKDNKDN